MNWESTHGIQELTCNTDLLIVYGTKKLVQSYDLQSILPHDELTYAARLKNKDQQETWLACRATLRLVLAKHLSIHPQSIIFQKGHFGKLYVADSNMFFNISHTNDAFVLALSTMSRVGIDIEMLNGNEDLPSLIHYAFSEDEATYCNKGNLLQRFTEVWTLKEAFLKAVGIGLINKLTSISGVGKSSNIINELKLNHKTFLCPQGETASLVYRNNQKLNFIILSRE